jgi:hypothetical protein
MLAAPKNPREVLELLARIDDTGDLDALFDKVDWSEITRGQFYQIVFGRLPETASLAVPPKDWSPRPHATAAVSSPEFQIGIRERILAAFPEKRRLIFIHIPKCAGTDLYEGVAARFPRVYEDLSNSEWISGGKFFLYLRNLVVRLRESDSIFIHGHVPLSWYINRNLYRFGDRIFTVVRNPIDIMLSQVNYVFKRFFEAPSVAFKPDVKRWSGFLGLESFDRNAPTETLVQLGLRMLRDQRIVPPNYLCTYLGKRTAESALEAVGRTDIEITDVERYCDWLGENWGLQTTYANKSRRILSTEHLDEADVDYLASISHEDTVLYERILAALERSGANSIRGSDLFAPAADRALSNRKS